MKDDLKDNLKDYLKDCTNYLYNLSRYVSTMSIKHCLPLFC